MAYVSDSNLTQFWGLAKDYINAEDCRFANWQKTEKAGAVTCWPVGGTPLLPTVDFLFTEVPPASGDKGPDNPSVIEGVESIRVRRQGSNLIYPYPTSTTTDNGITFTPQADGTIVANGTNNSGNSAFFSWGGGNMFLPRGVQYTISGCPSGGSESTYALRFGNGSYDVGNGKTFTASLTEPTQYIAIRIATGTSVNNLVFRPQLNLGSEVLPFEPVSIDTYTLPLGSTYYGGTVDLATGVMTVTWAKTTVSRLRSLVAKYTTTIAVDFDVPQYPLTTYSLGNYACNAFTCLQNDQDNEHVRVRATNGIAAILFLNKSRLDVSGAVNPSAPTDAEWLAAANTWVANHPFEFINDLYEPFTVQLTPTQILSLPQTDKYTPRLNTVYTDASAVHVGYAKSPIRSEYELTQAIIATEGGE